MHPGARARIGSSIVWSNFQERGKKLKKWTIESTRIMDE
jgi:hypothetical protein